MSIVKTDNVHYEDIAAAIREKNGSTALYKPSEMSAAIQAIKIGGGTPAVYVSLKDVNFYDYDGTLVASYTLAEAQSMTALPDGPTHDGLVFQGWNWTLEKINVLTRPMNVGAMYITDDGKTRLHIRVWDTARSNVPLYFSQTVANGVTIDWGDGSTTETMAGTGYVNTTHQYVAVGDYTITLDPEDGCTLALGKNSNSYCVMGSNDSNGLVYCNLLQGVQIGSNVTSISQYAFQKCHSLASITIPDNLASIGQYAFQDCYSLASITIPDSVTSIGQYTFQYCYSLASITIPDSVTSIGQYAFQYCYSSASITIPDSVVSISVYALSYCYSLASITIPDNITSISNYTFKGCYSLASITIPDNMTSIGQYTFQYCHSLAGITIPDNIGAIGSYTFQGCYSLAGITIPDSVTSISQYAFGDCRGVAEYHLKSTTPPALSSMNAFTGIPSDCVIYVPAGCLEAYQTATNWVTYADYMQEEPS